MVIKRKPKNIQVCISLSQEADAYLYALLDNSLIESRSLFIEKLILRFAPTMLKDNLELHETNIIVTADDFKRIKTDQEKLEETYNKLSLEDKVLLGVIRDSIILDGVVLPKFKKDYERFKDLGVLQ